MNLVIDQAKAWSDIALIQHNGYNKILLKGFSQHILELILKVFV